MENNSAFLLSREELVLLLRLLDANSVLGLDTDPLGALTDQQFATGLIYAERALRARQLAMLDEKGNLKVQSDLLKAIGTCAYPHKSLAIHCFPETDSAPSRYFFHWRSDKSAVVHSIPQDALHLLTSLADEESLLTTAVSVCRCKAVSKDVVADINLESEVLANARSIIAKGDAASAEKLLIENNANHKSATALVKILSTPHSLAVIHFLSPRPEDTLASREVTILHNAETAWLMTQSESNAENSTLALQQISNEELLTYFQDMWISTN